jgi:hypothetical protein
MIVRVKESENEILERGQIVGARLDGAFFKKLPHY